MAKWSRAVGVVAAALAALGALLGLAAPASVSAATAATLCVGDGPGCFSTIQAAVDAAHDGDSVRIGRGTFAGGVTIDKSIAVLGAGASGTVVSGGGPVLTIGMAGAATVPTVSISGVTIRGGVNVGDTTVAFGGGVLIPAAAGGATGARVTIADSVITQNRSAPTFAAPIGPPCPGGRCGFALGNGGGIANWGNLTLLRTTVSDNEAGGAIASDAHGGGIWSAGVGTLTVRESRFLANSSLVTVPNGRFAIGGGIHIQNGGALTIVNSVVADNLASLSSLLPGGIEMVSNGGGVHIGDGSTATIDSSRIDRNSIVISVPNGQPAGFDAGIIVGASSLVIRNSSISGNRVTATLGSSADAGPSGGAFEVGGSATINNTRITGNATTVSSQAGAAEATGAVFVSNGGSQPVVMSNSAVTGNSVSASSATGSATVQGAGIVLNNGPLELRHVRVSDNVGKATAPAGLAQGGGIWNGVLFPGPAPQLTLRETAVTGNALAASPGLTVQGGGLFTAFPVTLDSSRIAHNTPDQCFGC